MSGNEMLIHIRGGKGGISSQARRPAIRRVSDSSQQNNTLGELW